MATFTNKRIWTMRIVAIGVLGMERHFANCSCFLMKSKLSKEQIVRGLNWRPGAKVILGSLTLIEPSLKSSRLNSEQKQILIGIVAVFDFGQVQVYEYFALLYST